MSTIQQTIQLCECGCGTLAKLANYTNKSKGYVKGQPMHFAKGHRIHKEAPEVFVARFWSRVLKSNDTDVCWPWQGYRMPNGYGQVGRGGVVLLAHRVAYELAHGAIPVGMDIRHTCDNRPCVNPQHLIVGTRKENMQDAVERQRIASAERNGTHTHTERVQRGEGKSQSRLTEAAVRELRQLRASGATYSALATRFGVSVSTVSAVVSKRNWKHVE